MLCFNIYPYLFCSVIESIWQHWWRGDWGDQSCWFSSSATTGKTRRSAAADRYGDLSATFLTQLAKSSFTSYVSLTQSLNSSLLILPLQLYFHWTFVYKLLLESALFGPGHPSLFTYSKFSAPAKSLASWHEGLWHESLPHIWRGNTAECPAASFLSAWQLLPSPQDSSGYDISRPYFCKMCWKHDLETILYRLYLPS